MKTLIVLLCFALSTGACLVAQASDKDAVCKHLSSEIAGQSAAFLKINGSVAPAAVSGASSPELTLRRMDHKEAALDAAANEIWFLRARMFNHHCAQANGFQF